MVGRDVAHRRRRLNPSTQAGRRRGNDPCVEPAARHTGHAELGPVGDEEAHRLMKNYHRLLAQGLDAAQALELSTAGTEEGRLFCCYGADFTWPAVAPPQTAAPGTGPPPPPGS